MIGPGSDDVMLAEAVAKIDRYSRKAIVLVGDDSLESLRMSGLFGTGDNSFLKGSGRLLSDQFGVNLLAA